MSMFQTGTDSPVLKFQALHACSVNLDCLHGHLDEAKGEQRSQHLKVDISGKILVHKCDF